MWIVFMTAVLGQKEQCCYVDEKFCLQEEARGTGGEGLDCHCPVPEFKSHHQQWLGFCRLQRHPKKIHVATVADSEMHHGSVQVYDYLVLFLY